ncbi:26S proteasome regulatory subunit [Neophaeococcomyces mojaviensis]|uniref:26S proteasome regulatory subunit n=1 Tax=Neophaeococcomyces mojaviensis TaxID=3383035 RepID=A0ACC3ABC3_9EURO|nr:26S proteasome regulatory subunit [Knufia sp. JES_112]
MSKQQFDPEKISDFLTEQRDEAAAEVQPVFLDFEDFWERKLWHQLTEKLLEYFTSKESAEQRLALYNKFILSFADKINQLKLVKLALSAATQIEGEFVAGFCDVAALTVTTDDEDRATFLESLQKRVNKPESEEAHTYATTELAGVYLRLDEEDKAREQLDTAQTTLDKFDFVENIVHASFYRVNAEYYQSKSDFTSYYRNSLLYLACVNESELSAKEKQQRAYNLALAALVSDQIYNFGELLLHPILDALKPPHTQSWLRDLLFAFNRGDLATFDRLSNNLSKNEILQSHRVFLYQKISLAALTELVFKRPPHDRAMTFQTISHETKVKPNEIEHLLMKALSLGLLRGKIDQVDQVAKINWVQPKVLERSQIEGMRQRLKEWDSNVNDLGHWIEDQGKDVWAA